MSNHKNFWTALILLAVLLITVVIGIALFPIVMSSSSDWDSRLGAVVLEIDDRRSTSWRVEIGQLDGVGRVVPMLIDEVTGQPLVLGSGEQLQFRISPLSRIMDAAGELPPDGYRLNPGDVIPLEKLGRGMYSVNAYIDGEPAVVIPGLLEIVPGYSSLRVHPDAIRIHGAVYRRDLEMLITFESDRLNLGDAAGGSAKLNERW